MLKWSMILQDNWEHFISELPLVNDQLNWLVRYILLTVCTTVCVCLLFCAADVLSCWLITNLQLPTNWKLLIKVWGGNSASQLNNFTAVWVMIWFLLFWSYKGVLYFNVCLPTKLICHPLLSHLSFISQNVKYSGFLPM